MVFFALSIFVFFELIKWLIFLEILFSWLSLLGLHIAIPFVRSIVYPMFFAVQKILPVRFLWLDFSPLIVLFTIYIVQGMLLTYVPEIQVYLPHFGSL